MLTHIGKNLLKMNALQPQRECLIRNHLPLTELNKRRTVCVCAMNNAIKSLEASKYLYF